MSILIAVLSLTMGLLGVFHPSFFYKSELLTPEQIERNKRICNRGGVVLIVLGLALLILSFFVK
jgi:hypothetical protein